MHSPAGLLHPPLDAEAIHRLRGACAHAFVSCPAVAAAYLYGSGARGEPLADLDIGVLTDSESAIVDLEPVAAALEAEGAPHGPHLDLRPLRRASPRFRANVVRQGRVIFERNREIRIAFETQTLIEWLDFKPTWERMRARMFERWIHG